MRAAMPPFMLLRELLEEQFADTLGLMKSSFIICFGVGIPFMYSVVMLYDILKIP